MLLRELRGRSYAGGYTILKDWLQPQRNAARVVAVRRFETPPGKQAQVDWGHLGWLEKQSEERKLWGFTLTLGYSRMMMAEAALDQKLGTLLRMHEEAFRQLGGVPEEILYDRMKTVWQETDERGEIVWNPVFLGLRALLGLHAAAVPAVSGADEGQGRIGREVRAAELSVRLAGARAGLLWRTSTPSCGSGSGRWPTSACTGPRTSTVMARWDADQMRFAAAGPDGRRIPTSTTSCARWRATPTSPGRGAATRCRGATRAKRSGCETGGGDVEVRYGAERIAVHAHGAAAPPGDHCGRSTTQGFRWAPPGRSGKTLVHIRETAPVVEIRPLAAYESVAAGGAR